MFTRIHEIVFHGNGGYNFFDIYHMPIWMRNFIFEQIKKYYKEQQEAKDKNNKSLNPDKKEVARPNIPNPTYTTKKAPKK